MNARVLAIGDVHGCCTATIACSTRLECCHKNSLHDEHQSNPHSSRCGLAGSVCDHDNRSGNCNQNQLKMCRAVPQTGEPTASAVRVCTPTIACYTRLECCDKTSPHDEHESNPHSSRCGLAGCVCDHDNRNGNCNQNQ